MGRGLRIHGGRFHEKKCEASVLTNEIPRRARISNSSRRKPEFRVLQALRNKEF